MKYVCLKVDWTTANKVNGDFRVFVDPVIDNNPSCTDSYVLVLDQTDFNRISTQTSFTTTSTTLTPSVFNIDWNTFEPSVDLISFGFLASLFWYGLGAFFGLAIAIVRKPPRRF
jgi:hypothetical protein